MLDEPLKSLQSPQHFAPRTGDTGLEQFCRDVADIARGLGRGVAWENRNRHCNQ
jgi:hypothetical protein